MQNPSTQDSSSSSGSYGGFGINSEYPTPQEAQAEINAFLASKGNNMSEWDMTLLMNMMTGYSSSVAMVEANNQAALNKFMDEANEVLNQFDKGDNASANTPKTDADFYAALKKLRDEINSDPFFSDPNHKDVLDAINQTLDGIKSTVDNVQLKPGENSKIFAIWAAFNPALFPDPSGKILPSDSSAMDAITRNNSQLMAQLTNQSKIMQSMQQATMELRNDGLTTMNAYVLKFTKLEGFMNQKMGQG